MGCDIHAYIDYDSPKDQGEIDLVNYFGEINIFRHYALFGLMAGVRGQYKLFKPKGLPERLSWTTRDKTVIYIVEKTEEKNENSYTCEYVEKWNLKYTDDSKTRVWDPDFHTHSWLDTNEINKLLIEYEKIGGKCFALEAAYHAMLHLEDLKCHPRLIFWFDN